MCVFSGKVHFAVGLITYVYLAVGNSHLDHVLVPWMVLAGAMFPDCDHRQAPAGRFFPLWMFGVKHRGIWTHSIWALVGWSGATAVIFGYHSGLSFLIGYASHLFMDGLTPSGINWFGKKKKLAKHKRIKPTFR